MDMMLYGDTRESTSTCFRLDCGHAYHTKCVIQFLSMLDKKCPQCNSDKRRETEYEVMGTAAKKLLINLKQDETTKLLFQEYRESKTEYDQAFVDLKNKLNDSLPLLKQELKFDEKFEYFKNCKSALERDVKSKMGKWNNMSVGAMLYRRTTLMDEYIFKFPRYYWARYKTPRINLML